MIYAVSNHVWRCSEVFSDHQTSIIRYCNPPTINANCQRFISLTIEVDDSIWIPYASMWSSLILVAFKAGVVFQAISSISVEQQMPTRAKRIQITFNNLTRRSQGSRRCSSRGFHGKNRRTGPSRSKLHTTWPLGEFPQTNWPGRMVKPRQVFKIRSFYWDKIGW